MRKMFFTVVCAMFLMVRAEALLHLPKGEFLIIFLDHNSDPIPNAVFPVRIAQVKENERRVLLIERRQEEFLESRNRDQSPFRIAYYDQEGGPDLTLVRWVMHAKQRPVLFIVTEEEAKQFDDKIESNRMHRTGAFALRQQSED